jgi:cellulose synthase/poly-beta-1,6-N-acetylglucosamine synthase-like glycosyltransferase
VCEERGAIVYTRFNKQQVGKGYAMDWMFEQLLKLEKQYDAFAVFDADNLVHPDFLLEMNDHLYKGETSHPGIFGCQKSDRHMGGRYICYCLLADQ